MKRKPRKNTPFTHEEVKRLRKGFNPTAELPNRRMRRYDMNELPNSSKISRHSTAPRTKGPGYRTNRFK